MKLTFVVLVANIMRQFQQREEVCKAATSEGLLGDYLRHTFKFFYETSCNLIKHLTNSYGLSPVITMQWMIMTIFSPYFACRALLFEGNGPLCWVCDG